MASANYSYHTSGHSYSVFELQNIISNGDNAFGSFEEVLHDTKFCEHEELYNVAKEIINNPQSTTAALTRAYRVITSSKVTSLPGYLNLREIRPFNQALTKCEEAFNKHFDEFNAVDPYGDHLTNLEQKLTPFMDCMDVRSLWEEYKNYRIHNDTQNADLAWHKLTQNLQNYFPDFSLEELHLYFIEGLDIMPEKTDLSKEYPQKVVQYNKAMSAIKDPNSSILSLIDAYKAITPPKVNDLPVSIRMEHFHDITQAKKKCEIYFRNHFDEFYIADHASHGEKIPDILSVEKKLLLMTTSKNNQALNAWEDLKLHIIRNEPQKADQAYKRLIDSLMKSGFPFTSQNQLKEFLKNGSISDEGELLLENVSLGYIQKLNLNDFEVVNSDNLSEEKVAELEKEFVMVDGSEGEEVEPEQGSSVPEVSYNELENALFPVTGISTLRNILTEIDNRADQIGTIFVYNLEGKDQEIMEFCNKVEMCTNLHSLILDIKSVSPKQASQLISSLLKLENLEKINIAGVKDPKTLRAIVDNIGNLPSQVKMLAFNECAFDAALLNDLKQKELPKSFAVNIDDNPFTFFG